MGKVDFEKYLDQQQTASVVEINWDVKRDEWKDNLEEFYSQICGYLSKYEKSGKLSIERRRKSIHEELIGSYEVEQVIIKFNGENVTLDPIGTNLIGSKGRVDMKGYAGSVRFVLVSTDATKPKMTVAMRHPDGEKDTQPTDKAGKEYVWKIATQPPHIQFVEIDEDSFFNALMEVINGQVYILK